MSVDALLRNQIAAAQAAHRPVNVIVYFRTPVGMTNISSQLVTDIAKRVLRRTESSVGEAPNQVTVFENLNALSIGASPDFILQLAKEPEVLSVKLSQMPESFAFEPKKTPPANRPRKLGRKVR